MLLFSAAKRQPITTAPTEQDEMVSLIWKIKRIYLAERIWRGRQVKSRKGMKHNDGMGGNLFWLHRKHTTRARDGAKECKSHPKRNKISSTEMQLVPGGHNNNDKNTKRKHEPNEAHALSTLKHLQCHSTRRLFGSAE